MSTLDAEPVIATSAYGISPHLQFWNGYVFQILGTIIGVLLSLLAAQLIGEVGGLVVAFLGSIFVHLLCALEAGTYLHKRQQCLIVAGIASLPSIVLAVYFYSQDEIITMGLMTHAGFISTLVYACATDSMMSRPRMNDTCHSCGYSTLGLPSNTCPECGAVIQRSPSS